MKKESKERRDSFTGPEGRKRRAISLPRAIPHSINYEEAGTSKGLWDHLGRQKMPNKARPLALLLLIPASQSNATGFENVENDMFVIFRLPKRSHNLSPVPVSS